MPKLRKTVGATLLGGVALMVGCSGGAPAESEQSRSLTQELSCDLGVAQSLSNACTKANAEVSVTASTLASASPPEVLADSSAYGVRLVGSTTFEGALRFTPLQTTSYNIYLGAPNLPFRVVGPAGEVLPTCSSPVSAVECNKLRKVGSYVLTAGQSYRLEIGPTTAARYLRLYIQTRVEPVATCSASDLTRLSAACTDSNAGSSALVASFPDAPTPPSATLNSVYTITLQTVGTNTYAGSFTFTPADSDDYELYLGTPKIPLAVSVNASPVQPDCSRLVSSAECNLLRRGDRFSLQAGVTYRFTLGPNVNTHYIRATLRRSVGPDECALGTDNCDHDPNACVNTDDGFNCVCPAGFIGDGVGNDGCQPAGVTSSQPVYVLPVVDGVQTRAILSAGDSPNLKPNGVDPYRMAGTPDGLGAFDNGDGTFTLLSNHEFQAAAGIARAHGGTGSFVSRWVIRKSDLAVLHGEDLMQQVSLWNTSTSSYNPPSTGTSFARFCSADLAKPGAFYNPVSGLGFDGRLFLDGEESGLEGRALAHGMDGTSYELPRLGKMAFENVVANPDAGDQTVVTATDDGTGGQVYVYVGTKTSSGSPVERAGLTNGTLYGVRVPGVLAEDPATGIATGAFELVDMGNLENSTGATLESNSVASQITSFQRPEDSSWDPANPNDLYFITTASITGNSRLWRLRFSDRQNPALGGTIEMLLDGSEGHKMLDNLSIDTRGHIIALEDVGNDARLGRVWRYDIATDTLTWIAQFDPERFTSGAANFLTQDEETSGVIDATELLGPGWWLLDAQAHYSIPGELVEGGQYIALYDPATASGG